MSPTDRPEKPDQDEPRDEQPHDEQPEGIVDGMDELDAPPTDTEIAEAELLRDAIEKGPVAGFSGRDREARALLRADREFVQTIRAASSSVHLSSERNQRLIAKALQGNSKSTAPSLRYAVDELNPRTARGSLRPLGNREGVVALRGTKRSGTFWAFGVAASFLAMAAAVAVIVREPRPRSSLVPVREQAALAYVRSTAELFPEGIPRSGGTTSRVDRIAYARAQDLRQNQFARWGAR